MAVKNIAVYNRANDGMALPLSITRGNPNPLDDTYLYATLAEAQAYAKDGATAYVGQNICVLNTDVTDGAPVVYVIQDEAGTLKPVGDAADIFADPKWTAISDRIDLLDDTDDTKEGSLARIVKDAEVTVEQSSTGGIGQWDFYQNFTYSTEIDYEPDGITPKTDSEGNTLYKTVRTKKKIGTVTIDADVFIQSGSIVEVKYDDDGAGNKVQATDDSGNLIFEDDGITPIYKTTDTEGDVPPIGTKEGTYMKLKLSSGECIYIETASLLKGVITKIIIDGDSFLPNSNGELEITSLSTDILRNGDDTLVLVGGNAST